MNGLKCRGFVKQVACGDSHTVCLTGMLNCQHFSDSEIHIVFIFGGNATLPVLLIRAQKSTS